MTSPTQGEHAQTETPLLQLAALLENDQHLVAIERREVASGIRRLVAQVAALTAAQEVQAEPVKDEATCQMCGEKPYPGCNSEFQDEAACRFYRPATAQTELAHELFAAAQLAPGEGIEDAVSRIAATLTAPGAQAFPHTWKDDMYAEMQHRFELRRAEDDFLPIDDTQLGVEFVMSWLEKRLAAPAQPAAPQGVAYAELPEPGLRIPEGDWTNVAVIRCYTSDQMRDFADRTHSLRASNGQAPAGAHPWRSAVLDLIDECPGLTMDQDRWLSRRVKELDFASAPRPTAQAAPAAGAVAGPSVRKVFLVATGEEHEGEATYTRHDDAPPPLCDSECLYTAAHTPAAQADSVLEDAARWRRLVNASEMAFPVAAIVDDPENDAMKVYGRKRMEALIDMMDEIPGTYMDAARKQGDTHD